MAAEVYLAIAVIASLILFLAVKFLSTNKKEDDAVNIEDDQSRVVRPPPERRRRGLRKAVRRTARRQLEDDDEGYDEEDGLPDVPLPDGKIGTKKLRKLEQKAEKKAMKEQMEAEREDRKQREELRDKQRKREEEKRLKQREAEEEVERKRKEEQEKREYEEYLKLKESFSVEVEGSGEAEIAEESQSLLQEFIDYIKNNKVVLLEDVAAHFKLRTEDVINRIETLQSVGRLTGVVDDRGKFIYISKEELEAVAKFIKQRGRVSIAELAESSNSLINLKTDVNSTDTNGKPTIETGNETTITA